MPNIPSKDSISYSRHLLVEARHSLVKARQNELKPYHISPQQSNIMDILSKVDHKATLGELAKYTGRGINTVSMQMTRMEKDGLVRKAREVPKSTLLSFELTKHGLNIYKIISKMRTLGIMSIFSEEERQQLIVMLQKVIDEANKYQ